MGVQSIGMPVRREEDFRLLRGKGRYVDDVRLPREARGYVVRSASSSPETRFGSRMRTG